MLYVLVMRDPPNIGNGNNDDGFSLQNKTGVYVLTGSLVGVFVMVNEMLNYYVSKKLNSWLDYYSIPSDNISQLLPTDTLRSQLFNDVS